ncbi:MAG: DUF4391 domain-containing protein [Treponemataceae bacterium]
MKGLPKTSELSKPLHKKAIYTKLQLNNQAKEKIDADISRITIINEITEDTTTIASGIHVTAWYVLLIHLKKKNFSERSITSISKLIPQNMLMVLEYDGEQKLVVYHTKLLQTEWQEKDSLAIELKGLNLDTVWENIIVQVGAIHVEQGNTLEKQIEINEKKAKLLKEIERLEKNAYKEKQPDKNLNFVAQINLLKKELYI